ncbi:MAG: CHASE2 domain-containing protein [Thainema sp.]
MLEALLSGRYKILRILGTGGFGQTYVAEDTQHPERSICVVKHLRPSSQDPEFLQVARRLFDAEVEALRKLGQHDQIPALVDSFEEDGEFYFVQEFIDGYPFSEELAGGFQLGEEQAIRLLENVLPVLSFVHDNHVIHRDIKPGNIIRRRDGKLVLIDFGAVKEIQTQLTTRTDSQTDYTVGIGTQGYTPHEQLAGRPRYCSDIYALGITVIQALTGYQPQELSEDPRTSELLWEQHAQISEGLKLLLKKMTRSQISRRYQSAKEVLNDLKRLDELPDDPSFREPVELDWTQISAFETPRQRLVKGVRVVAIASAAALGLCAGARQLGWFEPLELRAYDQMVRLQPDLGIDDRLLVVEITEADLRELQRATPSDQSIADAIATLQQYDPRVIGVDLYRELPQEPGHEALMEQFADDNVIAIANIGNQGDQLEIPPPEVVPPSRVGFNDIPIDTDNVVRRNLMFATHQNQVLFSFSLRVALEYLEADNILPQNHAENPDLLQLQETVFDQLRSSSGGYQHVDSMGYQLLLHYRSANQATRIISLSEVLAGNVPPDWVRGKAVLIGTTAPSSKDVFYTPYTAGRRDTELQMPGVTVHAQMVSQILSAALESEQAALYWFWPDWTEIGWMALCAIAGGSLAWSLRRPIVLALGGTSLLIVIVGTSAILFTQNGWIPLAAPLATSIVAGVAVVVYRVYQSQRKEEMIATTFMRSDTTDMSDTHPM